MRSVFDFARAVAELLSEYSAEVTAAPDYDVKSLNGLRVLVMPFGRKGKFATRGIKQNEHLVTVAILQKCKDLDKLDQLVSKAEQIGDGLLGAKALGCAVVRVEWNPLYAVEELREKGLFVSVMNVVIEEFAQ